MHPSTRTARAPGHPDDTFGGLAAPIIPSTTFARDAEGGYPGGHSYTRDENPTGKPAEQLIADLEGGTDALLFASGMTAATTLLDALGDNTHVVAPRHMYWTIRLWLDDQAASGRLRVTYVPNSDLSAWATALETGGRQLAWIETPSNPMGAITDIAAVAEIAHAVGAIVVADNTTATPVHSRPIEHGADIVLHSATKQLNGHGDVLAGVLVTARLDETWDRVHFQRTYRGTVLGPFEAWLLLRGMRTLWVRVVRSSETALRIAEEIDGHPGIAEVLYPGLAAHPGHEIAGIQMDGGFGMLLSIRVNGGEAAARRVLNALEIFTDATSLGSTESLVEHRVRIEGEASPVPADLLRISIGLEDPDDLLTDLMQALHAAQSV